MPATSVSVPWLLKAVSMSSVFVPSPGPLGPKHKQHRHQAAEDKGLTVNGDLIHSK
jgi:hypothetical protein